MILAPRTRVPSFAIETDMIEHEMRQSRGAVGAEVPAVGLAQAVAREDLRPCAGSTLERRPDVEVLDDIGMPLRGLTVEVLERGGLSYPERILRKRSGRYR